jgi:hypothetical protein
VAVSAIKQISTCGGKLFGLSDSGTLWRLDADEPTGAHWVRIPAPPD